MTFANILQWVTVLLNMRWEFIGGLMNTLRNTLILLFCLLSVQSFAFERVVKGTIDLNGRKADLYSPRHLVGKSAPILLALHGGLTDSAVLAEKIKFNKTLLRKGMHGVFLNGTSQHRLFKDMRTWNAGKCCGSAYEQDVNDIAYIKGAIRELRRMGIANRDRVTMLGSSNGVMMSLHFACENNHLVKEVLSLGGTFVANSCTSLKNVSVYFIHGKQDTTVPLSGGGKGERLMGEPFSSMSSVMRTLSKAGAKAVKLTILRTGEHGADTLYEAAQNEFGMDLGELFDFTKNK